MVTLRSTKVERDREHDAALAGAGWTVDRIWEHEALGEWPKEPSRPSGSQVLEVRQ